MVTSHLAVLAPSSAVTVMVALPGATAVTSPVLETVATFSLLEVQLTFLFVALSGRTVAVRVALSPSVMVSWYLSSLIPATGVDCGPFSHPPAMMASIAKIKNFSFFIYEVFCFVFRFPGLMELA